VSARDSTDPNEQRRHWEHVYAEKQPTEVSWYQREPSLSLELIAATGVTNDQPIIDIGGGASTLVDSLLDRGFADVTVLDIAPHALDRTRERLGARARSVTFIATDVTQLDPKKAYAVWHDRAAFHFLIEDAQRRAYREVLLRSLAPKGHVVLATFAPEGPERCSGLVVRRASPDELASFFAPELTLRDVRSEIHHTPRGAEQAFTWVTLERV